MRCYFPRDVAAARALMVNYFLVGVTVRGHDNELVQYSVDSLEFLSNSDDAVHELPITFEQRDRIGSTFRNRTTCGSAYV